MDQLGIFGLEIAPKMHWNCTVIAPQGLGYRNKKWLGELSHVYLQRLHKCPKTAPKLHWKCTVKLLDKTDEAHWNILRKNRQILHVMALELPWNRSETAGKAKIPPPAIRPQSENQSSTAPVTSSSPQLTSSPPINTWIFAANKNAPETNSKMLIDPQRCSAILGDARGFFKSKLFDLRNCFVLGVRFSWLTMQKSNYFHFYSQLALLFILVYESTDT